jgi:hypothetical protein
MRRDGDDKQHFTSKKLVGLRTSGIVVHLPSRSIRIGVNPVGLLACGSSERNCLPSAFAPVACLLRSSPLTVAGPRRTYTGFPNAQGLPVYTALLASPSRTLSWYTCTQRSFTGTDEARRETHSVSERGAVGRDRRCQFAFKIT